MIVAPDDCRKCGACCFNHTDMKWIEVTEDDASILHPYLYHEGDIEKFCMKQRPSGQCDMLEGNVLDGKCECLIYEARPTICRTVQPNDSICKNSIYRYTQSNTGIF